MRYIGSKSRLVGIIDNYWVKNGIAVTTYETVMNKQRWYELQREKAHDLRA